MDDQLSEFEKNLLEELRGLERLKDLSVTTFVSLLFSLLAEDVSLIGMQKTEHANLFILDYWVGADNKGRVIGKKGHILKAIWSLSKSFARTRQKDVVINVKDD